MRIGDALVLNGDCVELAPTVGLVDAVVTDPPYGLAFMGKGWDKPENVAFRPEAWQAIGEAMKPGAHLVAFGGSRMFHRLVCAIEDAGFEIRDTLMWIYGTGFPKSHDIAKALDKRGGRPDLAVKIGDALRKAREARGLSVSFCDKRFCDGTTNWTWFEGRPSGQRAPMPQTFARIVADWPELLHLSELVAEAEREIVGVGKSGIGQAFGDGEWASGPLADFAITAPATPQATQWQGWGTALKPAHEPIILARKPLDGTVAANTLKHGVGGINVDACRVGPPITHQPGGLHRGSGSTVGSFTGVTDFDRGDHGRWPANVLHDGEAFGDAEWSRFFYSAKATKAERAGSKHPTVKPQALMRWLCRLVTPPGGTVLDPFAGSGSTGQAALSEGFKAILIEQSPEYYADIIQRLKPSEDAPKSYELALSAMREAGVRDGSLKPLTEDEMRQAEEGARQWCLLDCIARAENGQA